jgi:TP901 family phage tail tape measure protein
MADVNANIGVHIDTSGALAELKALQRQLANFHSSVSKSSAAAAMAQKGLQTNLLNSINATGKFRAQMGLVRTSTESFTHALETNKLSMREYFRYAGGSTKTFGKLFKQEFNTIGKVAEERVKKMQTQYIKMGRDASGAMKSISITPNTLNMKDYSTKLAVAAQKQALLNQLLKQGSTNLLNFGKNTQWAGRQLMVGFTIPLAYFGTAAAKTFMDLEKQAIRFKRVYGDMFTTTDQTNKALADVEQLAKEFTKYGVAVTETMEMAANAAAMGKTGADLTAQVAQATRLAVLGGVEQGQALETTISVTNAFGVAAEDLASKINFLNAVENQTVVSIEDLTEAIPKAGPVVQQLGGSVEDLAFFLTAMKEGGINASEGANALKSGLASLINPSDKAAAFLGKLGVNINAIVETNKGNIRNTVIDFSRALDTLDPLNRARAIEQLFGKFQFSRLSTLFQNVTKEGTQAARVLDLAGASIEELAILSERELGVLENAVGVNFKESIEKLKVSIAPIGKTFLEAVTPIVQVVGRLLDKFSNLGEGTKKFIVIASTLVGIIGPVLLMTFGLLANGVANIIKLFITMRSGFLRAGTNTNLLAQQTSYLNSEQLEAATVAASLNQAHTRLTQSFAVETTAVRLLRQAYIDATIAAANFARTNPGMMMPGGKFTTKKFASGTTKVIGGEAGKDSVPALLMPGEAVVPTDIAQNNKFKPLVEALVTGKIAQYGSGTTGVKIPQDLNLTGRAYNAKSARGAKDIQSFINSLQKNPDGTYNYVDPKGEFSRSNISASTIAKNLNSRIESNKFTLSEIKTKLGLNKEGRDLLTKKTGRTNAPKNIRGIIGKAGAEAIPGFEIEKQAIRDRLKQRGIAATQSQLDRLFQIDASHIKPEFDQSGNKIWKAKNVAADAGYVNNYISNSLKGKLGQNLSQMSPDQLKSLGIDSKTFNDLYAKGSRGAGTHPVTTTQAQTLQAIARYVISNPKGLNLGKNALYQAHALDAGLGVRLTKTGFYTGGGPKTLEKLAVGRGEVVVDKQGRSKTVTASTGKPRGNTTVIGGGPSDKRIVPAKNISKVIPTRFGFKGSGSVALGAMGGYDADGNLISTKPGMAISKVQEDFKAQQNSLRRQIEKVEQRRLVALKEELRIIEDKNRLATQTTPLTKQQLKEQKREVRAQRAQRVGSVAGPVAGLASMGSMAGFMTGNNSLGMGMMGVAALASIAPMLTNPLGLFVAGLVSITAVIYKFNKDMEKARQEGINLAKAMSMTNTKLIELSKITGKVSSKESADRKRQNLISGTVDQQRKFGQNVLESEFGKSLIADIATQGKAGKTDKEIATNMANQLSTAILQGVVTTEQAKSIASALGEKLGSYEIPLMISGELVSLFGPNGENLTKDPLQIALAIKKDSATNLQTTFDQAQNNRKQEVTAGGLGATGGGVAGLAAAGGMAATGVGLPAAAVVALLSSGAIVKAAYDQNKAKSANAKLDAASIQLGLEAIVQNQQLVDALNKQYDLKLKNAKTEKEIKDIESQRKIGLDSLNNANQQTINDVVKLSGQISKENFNKAIGTSVDNLYKNASDAIKVFKDIAKDELNDLANTDFKKVIQIGFASGELSPNAVIALLDASKQVPEIQAKINTVVGKEGFAGASTLLELITQTGTNAKTIDLMLNYINTNEVAFDKDMTALDILAKFQQKYGVQLDLTTNGVKQLTVANDALSKISTLPDKIDKTVVQKLAGESPTLFADALTNFDKLSEGKPLVSKTLLVNYLVGKVDPQIKAAALSEFKGMSEQDAIAAYLAKGYNAAVKKEADKVSGTNSGQRDTTFDDILTNLKRTRDATINAQGGAKELIRILGGAKDLKAFNGIDQQLSKIGANSDFIDFVGGLEKAIQNKVIKVSKKGVVALTDLGQAVKKAYDEKQLGLFSAENAQAINESLKQRDAFVKLKAAGLDTASAQELLADKTFMVSIAAQKNSDEIKKMINEYKNLKKTVKETQEITDPAEAFKDQLKTELEYYDFLERQARASVKLEIDRINNLIDANDRLIEAKERTIEIDINRPIDQFNEDLNLIDRSIAKINEKYDAQEKALEKISDINDDIASREASRISVADALTRGDLSAAAKAIQERRAEEARKAKERSSKLLQIAREKEIAKLTNADGLTKIQIEEKIYSLEQKRIPIVAAIVKLQDDNYTLQNVTLRAQEDSLNKTLTAIDAARFAYEQQVLSIDKAKFAALGFNKELESGEATLLRMKALWELINGKSPVNTPAPQEPPPPTDDPLAADRAKLAATEKAIKDLLAKVQTTTKIPDAPSAYSQGLSGGLYGPTPAVIQKNSAGIPLTIAAPTIQKNSAGIPLTIAAPKTSTSLSGGLYGSTPAVKQIAPAVSYRARAMGGIIPKYFVSGGYSKGTDTIPAMLTPGEFVVRKNAVDSFGVNNLNKINDGSYGGSSVYNYSLNVNVKSDSSPDDIARTVMTQIRRIDNQRIKGQR